MVLRDLFIFCALGLVLGGAWSQAAQPMPEGRMPAGGAAVLAGADGGLQALKLQGSQAELGTVSIVDAEEAGGAKLGRALRIQTRPGATTEWNVQVAADTVLDVAAGDVLLAHFFMRCTESMTGEGSIGFVFEQNSDPYTKAAEVRMSAGREWKEIFIPFQAREPFAAGKAHVCLRAGYDRQTMEVAGLEVLNFGSTVRMDALPRTKLTYAGRAADAPWRQAALERIERHRKGDLAVAVVDSAGKPVTDASVEIVLKKHAFRFGVALDAANLTGTGDDAEKYRAFVTRPYFNQMVFGNELKWPAVFNGVPAETDTAVAWLRERGFAVRGHNLIWGSWQWLPRELQGYRDNREELRRITREHITRTVSHFKGRLIDWDVVNEPYSEHDLTDLLGREEMVEWFKLARAADPAAKLYINDYGIFRSGAGINAHADHYFETIKFLVDRGAPLDGIGIQSHFASDLPAPEQLLATLDRFSHFGLPIHSTEISFDIEDRQLQADYLRDYVIAVFSHPNVNGMIHWGFWSKAHWRPQAAFFADDWTERPAGKALDELMSSWMTRLTLRTDETGRVKGRGFLGDYEVVVSKSGRTAKATLTLTRDAPAAVRVVLP